jgi:hypothetical protein
MQVHFFFDGKRALRWAGKGLSLGLLMILFGSGTAAASPGFVSAKNVTRVGHLDLEGGGMVDVKGNLAAIGHMGPPWATTLLDVSDPAHPRILSRIEVRPGTHSHKARICGSTLVINVERYGGGGDGMAGLALFDISDPHSPKETATYRTGGSGVHRFQLDCTRKLIYAGGGAEGFQNDITLIIDISDPTRPWEVGRWGGPGYPEAAGERPAFSDAAARTHHPLRLGNRLYVSLWDQGFAILDISNPVQPRLVSYVNYHKGASAPTHTALPVGHKILGKNWLIVFDEEMGGGDPPSFMRVYDIADEKRPLPAATFHVPRDPFGKTGGRFGVHQPHEYVGPDNMVYAAWFSGGLRVIDLSDPYRPREAGHYIPRPVSGEQYAQSNDLFVDERGFIYLIDRISGFDILRFKGAAAR